MTPAKNDAVFSARVVEIVKDIPKGKVATYGLIAGCLGVPRAARQVGRILHRLPAWTQVPWQRVVNRDGRISIIHEHLTARLQAKLLSNEGIKAVRRENFYHVDLKVYLWQPERIEVKTKFTRV